MNKKENNLTQEISWNAYWVKQSVRALREINNQNLRAILEFARDSALEKMHQQKCLAEINEIDVPTKDFLEANIDAYNSIKDRYELALNGGEPLVNIDSGSISDEELRSDIRSLEEQIEQFKTQLTNL